MEIILGIYLLFAGIIASDQYFEHNKSIKCSEISMTETNDLTRDYCLSQGKIEQGTDGIEKVNYDIKNLNELMK